MILHGHWTAYNSSWVERSSLDDGLSGLDLRRKLITHDTMKHTHATRYDTDCLSTRPRHNALFVRLRPTRVSLADDAATGDDQCVSMPLIVYPHSHRPHRTHARTFLRQSVRPFARSFVRSPPSCALPCAHNTRTLHHDLSAPTRQ